ncbi:MULTISPECIES: hypothetical protein [unclassified Mesorhizobium]|uniref:hypothetical protein n=1 Tax=unclassified Mesorhizobium TaxID=325217 RepID=UPI00112C5E29|nr:MULTISPECIES: hypothetical protein [unclassified Mesorhizobium]TPM95016.1 hypothetical protein FJ977_23500 [Mesorhizobium sp. B2-1-3A]BCG86557.1 hypothetical protein MesoLj113c_26670 [Mesorhizobium sp. 113-3-9]
MPKFRFETTEFDQTTISVEELASSDLASPRAVERAHAALVAGAPTGLDQSGSVTRVYDEAGYLVATVNYSDVVFDNSPLRETSEPPTEEPGVMRSG